MALNKTVRNSIGDGEIKSSNIEDGAITSGKISDATTISISKTPLGALPPTISSLNIDQIDPASGATVTITGTRFVSIPSVFFMNTSTGVRVTASTVGFTSSTTLTAAFPSGQTVGIYKVIVENPDGQGAVSSATITYSIAPAWSTAAGSLGSVEEGESVNFSLLAYDDDSTAVSSYTLQSGSLPSGVTLSGDSSVGAITGTAPAVDADTQYNFTIRATDNESQTSDRSFSMTVSNWLVANSLRFDSGSSDYLERTPSSEGNKKKWTWSAWIKRSKLGNEEFVFYSRASADNDTRFYFENDTFRFQNTVSNTTNVRLWTNRVFRDVSAWYHIIISYDSTVSSPDTNSIQMFVNGVKETSFSATVYPSQNQDTFVNDDALHTIGRRSDGASNYFNGYMAELALIDGQALTPTSFGETDSASGIWIPKSLSGLTFGTNGFYLPFKTSGSLGADSSGNSNDFTVNNLTSIDQTTDTPQNNYATLNPLNYTSSTITYSQGNTYATFPGAWMASLPTIGLTSGKWYWEAKFNSGNNANMFYGIAREGIDLDTNPQNQTGVITQKNDGDRYIDGTYSAGAADSFSSGDIVGLALDLDSGTKTLKVYKNGTLLSSSGTINLTSNFDDYTVFPIFTGNNSSATAEWQVNFGNPAFSISSGNSDGNGYGNFEYAVPSGYYALNTKNLAQYG